MGDPIIIWLPGTVFDYNGACEQYTDNWYEYACDVQPEGDGQGVYVTCCMAGG